MKRPVLARTDDPVSAATSAAASTDANGSTTALAIALRDSDRDYFMAGADNRALSGGILSVVANLSAQAGGCVFHSLDPARSINAAELQSLEHLIRDAGAARVRIYLDDDHAGSKALLARNGYRCVTELGLGGALVTAPAPVLSSRPASNPASTPSSTSQPYAVTATAVTADNRSLYLDLLRAAGQAPDGHPMDAGQFAALEHTKVNAGYMQPYLHIRDGRAIALASLHLHNGFARIKNVLVHPAQRGKGVGAAMVTALLAQAAAQGARYGGAFALAQNDAARRMYQAQGFTGIYQQEEWVKPLAHG